MDKVYYAKSRLPDGKQPTCREHLEKVAQLAGEYGAAFQQKGAARLAGQLHDAGKYSRRFDGVLRGTHTGVDHALGGAAILMGMAGKYADSYGAVIEAINGHHDGLMDYGSLKSFCRQSVAEDEPVCCNGGKTAALAGAEEYKQAGAAFQRDFSDFRLERSVRLSLLPPSGNLADMLYTRMLFSCLVDADYSVSAADEHPGYLTAAEDTDFDPELLLQRLEAYRTQLGRESDAKDEVNCWRETLFRRCGAAGKLPPGLFTLTAPTGTGKTLALLNFALRHCLAHNKRRIIIVLPFLTLAEQNAETYGKIVPNVLVDHSQSEPDDQAREFAQRWSAPFIITTSVKFFEALFAQRPTDCRKLHNIAGSVVVFDEAQSLPPELTSATLQAVNSLCRQYNCTMLFSTATQPDFRSLPGLDWRPTEINTAIPQMYRALRRTSVEWRLQTPVPLEEIAAEMDRESSVCAIVNRRDQARKLYRLLLAEGNKNEAFFLTTDLCACHRREIVAAVKQRLRLGLPCRLVATQCIEAGVDLDFQVMYRALAPLDAIIQAAGRCNRNGLGGQSGRVIVFEPDEEKLYPSIWYENAAHLVKLLLSRKKIDIHDPTDIRFYYEELFKQAAGAAALSDAIRKKDYQETAREYRLIKNRGVQVLAPAPGQEGLYQRLRAEALSTGIIGRWLREAAPITVATFDLDALGEHAENIKYAARKGGVRLPSDHYLLLPGHTDCYTADMGLQFRETEAEDYCV